MLKKKIWAKFQRIIDPGSGKNLSGSWIPDPGVKKGTGSRIRIRNGSVHNIFMFGPIEMVGLGLG
jgi:hypothetical protein